MLLFLDFIFSLHSAQLPLKLFDFRFAGLYAPIGTVTFGGVSLQIFEAIFTHDRGPIGLPDIVGGDLEGLVITDIGFFTNFVQL